VDRVVPHRPMHSRCHCHRHSDLPSLQNPRTRRELLLHRPRGEGRHVDLQASMKSCTTLKCVPKLGMNLPDMGTQLENNRSNPENDSPEIRLLEGKG
jgi:hypothetical protein